MTLKNYYIPSFRSHLLLQTTTFCLEILFVCCNPSLPTDNIYKTKPGDTVACNIFFVWEVLRPVIRGGAVIPIPGSVIYDGELLSKFIEDFEVTEMLFTPSLLEIFFHTVSDMELKSRLSKSL